MAIKKIRQSIKKIVYLFIDICFIAANIFRKKNTKNKSLLIVKLDAIGDYILFRNYLEEIRNSEKFKGYEIILCGNIVYKDLAENFDGGLVDLFVWIDKTKFLESFVYRIRMLGQICRFRYDYVVQPTFIRDIATGDSVLRCVNARHKIGSSGNTNISLIKRIISKIGYTNLIMAKDEVIFEFFRNKEFCEQLLSCKLSTKLIIDTKSLLDKDEDYAVCFIGASKSECKWQADKFMQVAKFIATHYKLKVIICGGVNDHFIVQEANAEISNLVGKTSILELINIINNAKFVVSNETSVPHIASALGVAVFVISNGNDIGQFHPYPLSLNPRYWIVYPDVIQKQLDDMNYLANRYRYGVNLLDVNTIQVDSVIKLITNNLGFVTAKNSKLQASS